MWLIDVSTLELKSFISHDVWAEHPYAILSHTWGKEEVSFQDMHNLELARQKAGFWKIDMTCTQALEDGLGYAWVDTCCIDKTSSAELQEAINSMFAWYAHATYCYAYICDVKVTEDDDTVSEADFKRSNWFSRGWTLQELLAPRDVLFYDENWIYFGSRSGLKWGIAERTGIDAVLLIDGFMAGFEPPLSEQFELMDLVYLRKQLNRRQLSRYSIAQRMSWAADRKTTRIEDRAYSLLGIFGIAMPLLYGEGRRSFTRLQEEIVRVSRDLSILAWENIEKRDMNDDADDGVQCLFAVSPDAFRDCGTISFHDPAENLERAVEKTVNDVGIKLKIPILQLGGDVHEVADLVGILNCYDLEDVTSTVALKLVSQRTQEIRGFEPAGDDTQSKALYLAAYSMIDVAVHGRTRTARLDVINAEQDSVVQSVVLLRERSDPDIIRLTKEVTPDLPDEIWVRFTSQPLGPCWNAISTYPEVSWHLPNLTFNPSRSPDSRTKGLSWWSDGDSLEEYTIGAVALQRYDVADSRVVLAFACPVGQTPSPRICFRIVKLEPDMKLNARILRGYCTDLIFNDLPWTAPTAKGVQLYEGSRTYDASVFAVQSEVRQFAHRWVAVLHVFDFTSLDKLRALDEQPDVPINMRG